MKSAGSWFWARTLEPALIGLGELLLKNRFMKGAASWCSDIDARDILAGVGFTAIVVGLVKLYLPLAFILPGMILMLPAAVVALRRVRE